MNPSNSDIPEFDTYDVLTRLIGGQLASAETAEVRRVATALYGRPDGLELLREVVIEEGMLRMMLERVHTEHEQERAFASIRGDGNGRVPSGRRRPLRNMARFWQQRIAKAAAVVLVVGGAAGVGARSVLRQLRHDSRPPSHTVATQPGQRATLDLPDGSRVILAPNSTLTYAIAANAGPRELQLDGEAYFEVLHDSARPFRVETRRAEIEDLGTTFVVREYPTDPVARVAVRTGAVTLHVKITGDSVAVHPGEVANIDSTRAIVRIARDSASNWMWTTGRLAFDRTPLPAVLAALNRWYDVDFQLEDSTLTAQYFTGAFNAAPLPQVLDILGPLVHARFEQHGRVVVVTRRPGNR